MKIKIYTYKTVKILDIITQKLIYNDNYHKFLEQLISKNNFKTNN